MLATIVLHNYLRTDILSNAGTHDDEILINVDGSNFSCLSPNRNRSSDVKHFLSLAGFNLRRA